MGAKTNTNMGLRKQFILGLALMATAHALPSFKGSPEPEVSPGPEAIVPESTQEILTETKLSTTGTGYNGATITREAYCSNRIGRSGGTPGPRSSLRSCAAAVNAHASCGNQFSYSTSTRACDCVPAGQTCTAKSYRGRRFYTFKTGDTAPPSPPAWATRNQDHFDSQD